MPCHALAEANNKGFFQLLRVSEECHPRTYRLTRLDTSDMKKAQKPEIKCLDALEIKEQIA